MILLAVTNIELITTDARKEALTISHQELSALYSWHKEEEYKCADKQVYDEAQWHLFRHKAIKSFIEATGGKL